MMGSQVTSPAVEGGVGMSGARFVPRPFLVLAVLWGAALVRLSRR